MEKINYNVDDYGVLRVYRGNAILFEAQDFGNTPKKKIENFIDEYLATNEEEMLGQKIYGELVDLEKRIWADGEDDNEILTKTGWWSVKFELTLDGESVRWEDLSMDTQAHILESIESGYHQGEIIEEGE